MVGRKTVRCVVAIGHHPAGLLEHHVDPVAGLLFRIPILLCHHVRYTVSNPLLLRASPDRPRLLHVTEWASSLLIAWLLGIVGMYTIGAFVHVVLVVALVLFVVGLPSGRRSLA